MHLADFPSRRAADVVRDTRLVADWQQLLALRDGVLAEIEPLRKDKMFGSSLRRRSCGRRVGRRPGAAAEVRSDSLPMLFIVSAVELVSEGAAWMRRTAVARRARPTA